MMQNNLIKTLVPVLAVIVLAESVVLISRFSNKTESVKIDDVKQETALVTTESTDDVNKTYSIEISSDKTNYKIGEQGTVTVKMSGDVAKAIDAIDLYVKYDPTMFSASSMTFDKKMPSPSFSKVSTTKNLLVANFLISNPTGLMLAANEKLNIMSFKIKAIKAGETKFEISTGNQTKESATMIVENGTSKPISFKSNSLSVNVNENK